MRISSEIGGRGGNIDFFEAGKKSIFGGFRHEKISDFKISFSCESALTYTIMIHNIENFYPVNLCNQRGFSVDGQKTPFLGSKRKRAAETLVLPPGPKLIWLLVHLGR